MGTHTPTLYEIAARDAGYEIINNDRLGLYWQDATHAGDDKEDGYHATENDAWKAACIDNLLELLPHLDDFTVGYLSMALWSSTNNSGDSDGLTFTQDNYNIDDFAPSALVAAYEICQDFQQSNADDLKKAYEKYRLNRHKLAKSDQGSAGADFWLSRNRHGSGYWDRGMGFVGDKLTSAAKVYSTTDLYINDNGLIEFMGE